MNGENAFSNEEVESNRTYSEKYKPKSIEEQVEILHGLFPELENATYNKTIAQQSLPISAEGYFAIPRWQSIGKTYEEALQKVLDLIKEQRDRFCNWREGRLGVKYLQRHERTNKFFEALGKAQKGYDILVVAAQLGLLHRGRSVRLARKLFKPNEAGLGAYEIACILLTHPELLQNHNDLWIFVAGDEYAPGENKVFSQVLYFSCYEGEFGLLSIWVENANEHYGSASAFFSQ